MGPVGSKPPAAVSMRISTDERHGFGAAAPLPTMASSLQGRAGGLVESSPKLARHIGGPASTLFVEQLSPCFACSAAASSVRLRVLMSGFMSASMARRSCRASCSKRPERCLVFLIFSVCSLKWLFIRFIQLSIESFFK